MHLMKKSIGPLLLHNDLVLVPNDVRFAQRPLSLLKKVSPALSGTEGQRIVPGLRVKRSTYFPPYL